MSTPRITVGLPVYKGADLIPKALDCLQRQTFGNFEAIISVDGNDDETAAACRPFLTDPRFRMVVHPERLDWVGNFNGFCSRICRSFSVTDSMTTRQRQSFFEVLLQAADKEPNAAAIYCDCQYIGGRNDIEIAPSIEGEPLDRMFQYHRTPHIIGGAGERSHTEGCYSTSWPREVRRIPCALGGVCLAGQAPALGQFQARCQTALLQA